MYFVDDGKTGKVESINSAAELFHWLRKHLPKSEGVSYAVV